MKPDTVLRCFSLSTGKSRRYAMVRAYVMVFVPQNTSGYLECWCFVLFPRMFRGTFQWRMIKRSGWNKIIHSRLSPLKSATNIRGNNKVNNQHSEEEDRREEETQVTCITNLRQLGAVKLVFGHRTLVSVIK